VSMSTSVVGIRDLDGQFAKMIALKEACEAAGVSYPDAVVKFFGPDQVNESVDWLREQMEEVNIDPAVARSSGDGSNTWEVDLKKLPPDVKGIRFRNGY
jgi:hypothetical protein